MRHPKRSAGSMNGVGQSARSALAVVPCREPMLLRESGQSAGVAAHGAAAYDAELRRSITTDEAPFPMWCVRPSSSSVSDCATERFWPLVSSSDSSALLPDPLPLNAPDDPPLPTALLRPRAVELRTTLMIRGVPPDFTRSMLEALFDAEGFRACYNFIYLPADFSSGNSFHYAFVNLVVPEEATRFQSHFTGFNRWPAQWAGCADGAVVEWSGKMQGFDELVQRYRNSPLMHARVPAGLRPAVYSQGQLVEFPAPTKLVFAPRVRRG